MSEKFVKFEADVQRRRDELLALADRHPDICVAAKHAIRAAAGDLDASLRYANAQRVAERPPSEAQGPQNVLHAGAR